MKIKEGDFFTFKGNFIKRTNHEFYQEMTLRRMHYTDDYGVKKHDSFDKNQYDFDFGILVYTVDTIMSYRK